MAALVACARAAAAQATESTAMRPVVRAMCGKRVALLGESPVHGFGETLTFKVALVRQLVDECHFNAIFIESGFYDYLNLEEQLRSGHAVTDAMIAAAIGGLWANREVRPLIPFLREKASSGGLYLGGLDDGLDRGSWAQTGMPAALVESLQGGEKARCLTILEKHMLWQYTDASPYGPEDRTRILGCLNRIDARLATTQTITQTRAQTTVRTTGQTGEAAWRNDEAAMIASLRRSFARDFPEDVPAGTDATTWGTNARDRSMYLNFRWLLAQLPPHSKVIVWAATPHVAKELSTVPGDEKGTPLGFYIRRDFGDRAFVLGFSAYSGSYAFVRQPVRELSPAPANSLEGRSFAGRDAAAVYLSRNALRKMGPIAARPLGTTFVTARWDAVLDGLVIFRRERAPAYLQR
ncbi:MAG TPA: erythromycin esterase family protein [Acidobacteriaceae bacterium]|nr:erythromycin esterase family protein [Acidobacteriaceae bacterium]